MLWTEEERIILNHQDLEIWTREGICAMKGSWTEEECIFCDTNAANHTFEPYRQDENDLHILKIWPAFEGLFKRVIERHKYPGGKIIRSSHQPNETTCPQAEICLIGSITPDRFINYDELNKFTNGQ